MFGLMCGEFANTGVRQENFKDMMNGVFNDLLMLGVE
jgi:hypothetical protein